MKSSKNPNIRLNYLYNVLYQILLVITPLIVSPYISRVLGSENIGIYSYTYSIAHYFALFCALGVKDHGSRSIAVCRDRSERSRMFSEIFSLQFYLSSLVIVAYILFVAIFANAQNKIFFWLQLFYIVSVAADINWLYFGLEEFKVTVTRKVIIKVISVAAIFLFVRNQYDLITYTIIMGISYIIGEAYLWLLIHKKVKFSLLPIKQVISHIKPFFVLFIPVISVSVYRIMDKIMLGSMSTMNSVGQYENAEKIVMILLGFVSALGTVMLPRMAKLNAQNDKETMQKYLTNSIRYMMLFAFSTSVGIFAVGQTFAPLFFGSEFIECGKILQIISLSIIPIAWANIIRTQYLIPCHKDKIYIISTCIGAVINLVINLILIPYLDAIGAAIATVITEFIVCIIQTVFTAKEVNIFPFIKISAVYLIFSAIMYIGVILIGKFVPLTDWWKISIQVICGILIYGTLSLVYLFITDKEAIFNLFIKCKSKLHKR